MNRRLGGDASLNSPLREDGEANGRTGWSTKARARKACSSTRGERHAPCRAEERPARAEPRERRIFEARRLATTPSTLGRLVDGNSRFARARAADRVRAFEKVQAAVKATSRLADSRATAAAGSPRPEATFPIRASPGSVSPNCSGGRARAMARQFEETSCRFNSISGRAALSPARAGAMVMGAPRTARTGRRARNQRLVRPCARRRQRARVK